DADDDFHRMDRQKCLMKDIAEQADPQKVVTHFESLANAAKKTISTNIPAELLPALVKLSGTVKHGAEIHSLPFNPYKMPGFHVYQPNIQLMRSVTAKAIADSQNPPAAKPSATTTAKKHKKKTTTSASASATPSSGSDQGSVSLKNICG